MKALLFISTCLLTACQAKSVEDTTPSADETPPTIQSSGDTSEAQVDVVAEAKMNTLLDIIKTNKLSLSNDCSKDEARVGLFSEHFNVGRLSCDTDGIKVFMGSSEIEFKLKNCKKNDKQLEDTSYVLGVVSKNKFQLINEKEQKQPVYVCN